jgi:hypothetical protein
MKKHLITSRLAPLLAGMLLGLSTGELLAQNIVPNPGFDGLGGVVVGAVNLVTGGVPDQWRAFAVGGGAIDLEIQPVPADELFPGSPATSAVLLRVTAFGADQGFDDDNGRFPITPGLDYQVEVFVRSANADGSDQTFHMGFPLFNGAGIYQGIEPGGLGGQTATASWQKFTGPTFRPSAPVAQGHISWRGANDGGEENAILIALPLVTSAGTLIYPTGLACKREKLDVNLSWQDNQPYEKLRVLRSGTEIASLDTAATSFRDLNVPDGKHAYQVLATFAGNEDGPGCDVAMARLAIGTKVSVDLNDVDLESGLANNVRADGGDGENEFIICGPQGDLREARSNFGPNDPTPDFGDPLFYFNVTDPAMKAQTGFRLEATVYDDPDRAGAGLYLQYTNDSSTGPADIANTFFPLAAPPVRSLAGTGQWVALAWDIGNAGFQSFQQGQADFRLGVTDGGRVCMDRADLTYFPVPTALSCRRKGDGVELAWENNGTYANIKLLRDGTLLAQLPGDSTTYTDTAVAEGDHAYQAAAVAANLEGGPTCTITVFFVTPGTRVSVDLGDVDVESGLANTRPEGGDGESELVICGREGDLREARSNYAAADPTVDAPDFYYYFNVTDPAMKAQAAFKLEVTVFDDAARAGAGLALQYTNQDSTGPGDIPNTFFPLETPQVNALSGSGDWAVLAWDIQNAGFRSFQQGFADFRLGVTDGGRVCVDKVELVFGEATPPLDTPFHRGDTDQNGQLQLTDAVQILSYLFLGLPTKVPDCLDAADADDNGQIQLTDAIRILGFLFLGSASPAPPGPPPNACGADPSADGFANKECVYRGC